MTRDGLKIRTATHIATTPNTQQNKKTKYNHRLNVIYQRLATANSQKKSSDNYLPSKACYYPEFNGEKRCLLDPKMN